MVLLQPHIGEQRQCFEEFVVAGAASCISKSAAAPLERARLRISVPAGSSCTLSFGDSTRFINRMVREEGFCSLWRGNATNVLRYAPTQALNFAFNAEFKRRLAGVGPLESQPLSSDFVKNVAAGGLAGVASLIATYPLDYLRTRLATDGRSIKTQRQFNSLSDCCVKVIHEHRWGPLALYQGFGTSCVGVAIYRGLYFGLYGTIQPRMPVDTFAVNFLLGWAVTAAAGLASYPVDAVRRRMWLSSMSSGEQPRYRSSLDCLRQLVATEGAGALMKGAGALVVRSLTGAGVLAGADALRIGVYWAMGP